MRSLPTPLLIAIGLIGSAQNVDMVLERGFLSDVTIPISDMSQRSLEYPTMHISQSVDLDFSAHVANLGQDTATNVIVALSISHDGIDQGTFTSDTIPFWAPGEVDTVVIDAGWNAGPWGDAVLAFQVDALEPDTIAINNADTAIMHFSYDMMSRWIGPHSGLWQYDPDDYSFVMARFEVVSELTICFIGCVIPFDSSSLGAYMGAVLLDENLNEIAWSADDAIAAYEMSDPGEAIIAWNWVDGYPSLQPGHDYWAGVALFGGIDTMSIGSQGTAPDSSVMVWNSVSWTYIDALPLISIAGCPGAIPEMQRTLDKVENAPNPSFAQTTISYVLARSSKVSLLLHDLTGRQITLHEQGSKGTGKHSIMVDTRMLPPGVYTYTLMAEGERVTRRMVVMR